MFNDFRRHCFVPRHFVPNLIGRIFLRNVLFLQFNIAELMYLDGTLLHKVLCSTTFENN